MIIAAKAATAVARGLDYQWVAVGASGKISTSTSTTASTWTARTSSFGTTEIWAVASNRTSLYVAVGDSGKLATSPDGITWTQRTSSFSTTNIFGIAWSGSYWVACGDSGKIATSTDGITWTQRTSGTADNLSCSAYGNNLYLVGGAAGTLLSATDPTSTWTSRTSTISSDGYIFYNDAIYYAPDQAIWVLGFDGGILGISTGTLASSTDGTTWTSRNSPFNLFFLSVGGFTSTGSIIIGGITVDGSGPTTDVMSSTNGTTWTNRAPADTTEYTRFAAVDDAGFMVVGGPKIQSTTDGVTYTDRGNIDGGAQFYGICHSAGKPSIR